MADASQSDERQVGLSSGSSGGQAGGLTSGKLPADLLFSALAGIAADDLLQGPGIGRDAAVIKWGNDALVMTADPITFVDANAGKLAVQVNANDIFALGAEPRWLLATILAPVGASESGLRSLLMELREACDAADIALVGGHTELTDAVQRTILSCALIGSAPLDQIIPSDGARAGDRLIQAGRAAVEGTAILGYPQLLHDPGLSVARAARTLREIEGVHAMHDVTEGGIGMAAWEMAAAAELGVEIDGDALLWLPETLALCNARGLDPLGLLGSGTLLAAVSDEAVDPVLASLTEAGVEAASIGLVTAGQDATLKLAGLRRPLPRFWRDEALRALPSEQTTQDESDAALEQSATPPDCRPPTSPSGKGQELT